MMDRVEGVLEEKVQTLIDAIVSNANNPQTLLPTFYLSPEVIHYEDRKIVYL
ncbi:hypothetical protein [Flavisolibacter tropicus]|uniref:hypothetical protein n=1 Tax=Flavisolibacter tropicus TaxID=1492898 RepID=UPI001396710A|nr:hypothetical protein [Flavisolibacter tropicus]